MAHQGQINERIRWLERKVNEIGRLDNENTQVNVTDPDYENKYATADNNAQYYGDMLERFYGPLLRERARMATAPPAPPGWQPPPGGLTAGYIQMRRGSGLTHAQNVPVLHSRMMMHHDLLAGVAADELNEDEKLHRDVANESYTEADKRKSFGDYEYQPADSSLRTGVWHNKKSNKTIIGYRGTKDLKDLYSDVADPKGNILRGTHRKADQYKNDVKHYDAIKQKYGGEISVTGHSYGGSRTESLSKQRNVRGQAFNVGRGFGKEQISEALQCKLPKRFRPKWCDKMTRHHIRGDPLSVIDRLSYGKTKVYDSRGLKSHMMSSFYK